MAHLQTHRRNASHAHPVIEMNIVGNHQAIRTLIVLLCSVLLVLGFIFDGIFGDYPNWFIAWCLSPQIVTTLALAISLFGKRCDSKAFFILTLTYVLSAVPLLLTLLSNDAQRGLDLAVSPIAGLLISIAGISFSARFS
jgi:hypothetical protein